MGILDDFFSYLNRINASPAQPATAAQQPDQTPNLRADVAAQTGGFPDKESWIKNFIQSQALAAQAHPTSLWNAITGKQTEAARLAATADAPSAYYKMLESEPEYTTKSTAAKSGQLGLAETIAQLNSMGAGIDPNNLQNAAPGITNALMKFLNATGGTDINAPAQSAPSIGVPAPGVPGGAPSLPLGNAASVQSAGLAPGVAAASLAAPSLDLRKQFPSIIKYAENSAPDAVNPDSGARGSMQVRPATAAKPGFGVRPAADDSKAEYERVGQDYSRGLLDTYQTPALAAAAYNWGTGHLDDALAKYGDPRKGEISETDFLKNAPAETQKYVARAQSQLPSAPTAPQPVAPNPAPTVASSAPANALQAVPQAMAALPQLLAATNAQASANPADVAALGQTRRMLDLGVRMNMMMHPEVAAKLWEAQQTGKPADSIVVGDRVLDPVTGQRITQGAQVYNAQGKGLIAQQEQLQQQITNAARLKQEFENKSAELKQSATYDTLVGHSTVDGRPMIVSKYDFANGNAKNFEAGDNQFLGDQRKDLEEIGKTAETELAMSQSLALLDQATKGIYTGPQGELVNDMRRWGAKLGLGPEWEEAARKGDLTKMVGTELAGLRARDVTGGRVPLGTQQMYVAVKPGLNSTDPATQIRAMQALTKMKLDYARFASDFYRQPGNWRAGKTDLDNAFQDAHPVEGYIKDVIPQSTAGAPPGKGEPSTDELIQEFNRRKGAK